MTSQAETESKELHLTPQQSKSVLDAVALGIDSLHVIKRAIEDEQIALYIDSVLQEIALTIP